MKTMILILALCVSFSVHAQWSGDPTVNNPVCTATGQQYDPTIVSDGAGGTIITWDDFRSGTTLDIYVQRLNASGAVQWTANGVAVCDASNDQLLPAIISDGVGGTIITWSDYRSGAGDIYAQRVDASGAVQWAANGVVICNASGNQGNPAIVSDGVGGAIITWDDGRSGGDIYAQRINSSGVVQWTANGVAISTATNSQAFPRVVSDGSAGAIISWHDFRSGTNYDVYAQRINASGVAQWTANGVAISTASSSQYFPTIVSDGASGAIMMWPDTRNGSANWDIYAQRINASGVVQWTTNGVVICNASNSQFDPRIATDGANGAIVTWQDERIPTDSDIFVQRVDGSGTVQWAANGIALSTATGNQGDMQIIADGSGGAFIAWSDIVVMAAASASPKVYDLVEGSLRTVREAVPTSRRLDSSSKQAGTTGRRLSTIYDPLRGRRPVGRPSVDSESGVDGNVYAQRVNASGVVQWTANGVTICSATNNQYSPSIVSEASGGAIIAWSDERNGTSNNDIYAQRVSSDGALPVQLASFTATVLANNRVRLDWRTISEVNNYGFFVQKRRAESGEQFVDVPNSFVVGHGTTNEPHEYSFTENNVPAGRWLYRLRQVDLDGTEHFSEPINVSVLTSVADNSVPEKFELQQNYPNPFNPSTKIKFSIPSVGTSRQVGSVSLRVYDVVGREVATLVNENLNAGSYQVTFNAEGLASGVYLYRLMSGGQSLSRKLLIAK